MYVKNILEYYNEKGVEILDQPQRKKSDNVIHLYIKRLLNDNLSISQVSGMTLTFQKKFHSDDPRYLHKYVIKTLNQSRIWKRKEYILFPEFSAKHGILHYHGCVMNEYEVEVCKMLLMWRRKFGFAKPEMKIRKMINWNTYITKDYDKSGLWTIIHTKKMNLLNST